MKLGSERRDGRGTLAGLCSADPWLCEQGWARGPRGHPRRAAFGFRLQGWHLRLGNHTSKRACVFILQVTWLVLSRRKVCRPAFRAGVGATLGPMLQCPFRGLLQAPSALELTAEAICTYFQKKSLRKHGPANSTPSLRSQVSYLLSLWEDDFV